MAESTLSIAFTDLQTEAGAYLGYTTDTSVWSNARTAEVARIVKSGLRRFYKADGTHRWSFLYPLMQLNLSSGVGDYDLPDDCGGLWGSALTLRTDDSGYRDVTLMPEGDVRSARVQSPSSSGDPYMAAVRPKAMLQGSGVGQRLELILYPVPGSTYTLEFRYYVLPDALDSTKTLPYGGMIHAETLREAVLSACEISREDMQGPHTQEFNRLLAISIQDDKFLLGPAHLGYNGDCSDGMAADDDLRRRFPNTITYNGASVE